MFGRTSRRRFDIPCEELWRAARLLLWRASRLVGVAAVGARSCRASGHARGAPSNSCLLRRVDRREKQHSFGFRLSCASLCASPAAQTTAIGSRAPCVRAFGQPTSLRSKCALCSRARRAPPALSSASAGCIISSAVVSPPPPPPPLCSPALPLLISPAPAACCSADAAASVCRRRCPCCTFRTRAANGQLFSPLHFARQALEIRRPAELAAFN